MKVMPYATESQELWNRFVTQAKNGIFLFFRGYMEYHADRYQDNSLLIFDQEDHLVGLFPASRHGDEVVSHGGLTYGGIISHSDMKISTMLCVFDALLTYLHSAGFRKLIYKPIPHIFHRIPAEEDLYALFRHHALLYRRDLSSAIWLSDRLPFSKRKREGIRKSRRIGLQVRDSTNYEAFFEIGVIVMRDRHKGRPAHTAAEMSMLAQQFPQNIHLHAAFHGERMLAGAVIFEYPTAAHTQYLYSSDEGLKVGALDLVIDYMVNDRYTHLRFLSFGISTTDDGQVLNQGLVHYKEMFGARSVVNDFYEIPLS